MSTSTRDVLGICSACAEIMDTISPKAIASYVISMTRQASNVMEVYLYSSPVFVKKCAFQFCRSIESVEAEKGDKIVKIMTLFNL